MNRRLPALFAALALMTAVGSARAQPAPMDKTLAQSLFDEGHALLDQGKVADACERFEKSQKLAPGGGTILNLALCHEKLGKVATAWAEFNDALAVATKDGRQERVAFAREEIDKLAPRLPKLTIAFERSPPVNPSVRLDGAVLPPLAIGVAAPVDPGEHAIDVDLPGKKPFALKVTLAEGEAKTVTVPELEVAKTCPDGRALEGDHCVDRKPPGPRVSTASWLLAGGGALALVGAGVTGVFAVTSRGQAASGCNFDRHFCTSESAKDAASRATTLAWVSTALLGAGVVAIGAAYFLPRTKPGADVSLRVGPASAAVRVDY